MSNPVPITLVSVYPTDGIAPQSVFRTLLGESAFPPPAVLPSIPPTVLPSTPVFGLAPKKTVRFKNIQKSPLGERKYVKLIKVQIALLHKLLERLE